MKHWMSRCLIAGHRTAFLSGPVEVGSIHGVMISKRVSTNSRCGGGTGSRVRWERDGVRSSTVSTVRALSVALAFFVLM